jgi:DNA (cytosine-5)-methyltransferase 1
LNGLALCAGYGGLELGIERVFPEARTVCYVEGEAFAAQHLVKKMEEGWLDEAPIWSNVKTFNGSIWRGKVDFISGGFPCQPYSTAGKQMGETDPRDLWQDFVRIIGEVRPGFIFLENVPNIVKMRLDTIVLDLHQLGYHASWCVVAASDVGAPHRRRRWFCMAVLRNSNGHGLISDNENKESSKRIFGEGGLERHRFENISHNDSNSKCCRWNENKQPSPEREFDFEGVRGDFSNTKRGGSNKVGQLETKFKEPGCEIIGCDGQSQFPNTCGERLEGAVSEEQWGRPSRSCGKMEERWGGGFEEWWKVEPSMGRLVDGASDWVDKLRILGNGVVPQQAAYAFQILGERLACGIVENRTPKD